MFKEIYFIIDQWADTKIIYIKSIMFHMSFTSTL